MFNKIREPVNAVSHLLAAVASLAGLIVLLVLSRDSLPKTISLGVYGGSLFLLFSASTLYHTIKAKPELLVGFRKLDHAAIYLLIAGTYTPFCAISFEGFWKWGLLAIIWSLAAIGVVVKVYMIQAPRWLTAGLYILLGWLCLAAIGEMLRVLPTGALIWLILGGFIYTFGAVIYITKAMNFWPGRFGFHEVWHLFVILGALAHFIAIAVYLAPS